MLDAAFLADIAENPDDDAPRLIYADWLEEGGDAARAAFIRVQVRLARLPADAYEGRELRLAERQLLAEHGPAWRGTLPALPGVTWGDFARGFVEAAEARTARHFLDSADALFRAAPVRRLRVRDRIEPAVAAPLAASPHLGRLTELNVGNGAAIDPEAADALLASPHLGALRCLLLHYNDLGDRVFTRLAAASLPRLEELYLSGAGATQAGLLQLADGVALATLTGLDLRDNLLDDGTLRALGRWACAPRLRTLFLVNNRLRAASYADLGWPLPAIERLYLNHNPLGDDGARALIRHDPPRLHELDLRSCGLTDVALLSLACSPLGARLRRVWLAGNPIDRHATRDELRRLLGPRLVG